MKKFLILMSLIVAIVVFASSCSSHEASQSNSILQPINTPTASSTNVLTSNPSTALNTPIPKNILELGKATTVVITGRTDSGSGVIIDKQENTYYVLTAAHVVGTEPTEEEVPYKLTTIDNEEHIIADYNNYKEKVKKFPQPVDLAVIEFTAEKSQQYKTVPIAESIFLGMPVYGFGWTNCEGEQKKKILQITKGEICEIQPNNENDWDVSYTNNSIQGVSGGAIIDQNGHLVAIQAGLNGGGSDNQKCQPAPQTPNEAYAYGLGVSLGKEFETLKLKLSKQSQIKLNSGINRKTKSSNNITCRKKVDSHSVDTPPILPPEKN